MATILTDDFNSYNDGDLDGQGDWAISAGSSGDWQVQGIIVKEGTKAAYCTSKDANFHKQGTLRNDGRITIYWRSSSLSTYTGINLMEMVDTTPTHRISVFFGYADGKVEYYDGTFHEIGSYSANTWICLEIEWRSSDHKARYRVDAGTWTDWDTPRGAWTNGIDIVRIDGQSGADCWCDYIAENPLAVAAGRSYGFIIG